MESVIDEAGMCVVNTKSISRRLVAMKPDEKSHVSSVSSLFLAFLIRLAHCPDANMVKNAASGMVSLLLNKIFNNDSLKDKFQSFQMQQQIGETKTEEMDTDAKTEEMDTDAKNISGNVFTALLSCLDPTAILASAFGDCTGHGDSLCDGFLSVLKGYNPLKIDDIVMLKMCHHESTGCAACKSLKQMITDLNPTHGNVQNPSEALLYFLRCMNHDRFNFGGDAESAMASPAFLAYEKDPSVIIVPLRSILLSCVDISAERTLARFGDEGKSYCDGNNSWVNSLYQTITELSLEDRAFIAHIYIFLMFSRHRQQSGDFFNQFLYTIFVRFLYSATEILFCSNANSSREVDKGTFLRYVEAVTNTAVMASSFFTMKTYLSWREAGVSVAPIIDFLPGSRKKNYATSESLIRLGENMANYICDLTKPSKLNKKVTAATTSGLDSIRSKRQLEKYTPFGIVTGHTGTIKLNAVGILPPTRNHTSGQHIECNCFHILPCVKGGEVLGITGWNNQSSFIEFFSTKAKDDTGKSKEQELNSGGLLNWGERGTGKVLGLFTGFVDKTVLTATAPTNSIDMEKKVNDSIRDTIFSNTMFHEDTVHSTMYLPDGSFWHNPSLQGFPTVSDLGIHALFFVWQRPNVDCPNVSALTASQLELLLSRDPKWAPFITRFFFNIDRLNFQLADAILKNMEDAGGDAKKIFNFLFLKNLKDVTRAKDLLSASLGRLRKDWAAATMTGAEVTGFKAQCTSHLYEILHKIVIEEDMNPEVIVTHSDFLRNAINSLDEFLMKTLH